MAEAVELLTPEWVALHRDATADLPERPGASARIEYRLTGGADGDATFHLLLEDGRIVGGGLGPDGDADFTVLLSRDDYLAVLGGELDQNVGFMQGRVKVTGNIGRMLSVLPVTTSPEWHEATGRVLAATTS
jgi:alkyl sulfatase BDS1-like metallo-beta-lactamase superfamily hydrolase